MSFRSKVDWWLAALVAGALLLPVLVHLRHGWNRDSATTVLVVAIGTLLICAVGCPVRYTLGESGLRIRSGLWVRNVPFEKIVRVSRTHNPMSAAAWSLDRLRIDLNDAGMVLISPVEPDRFMAELAARANLQQHGHDLVRQPESKSQDEQLNETPH